MYVGGITMLKKLLNCKVVFYKDPDNSLEDVSYTVKEFLKLVVKLHFVMIIVYVIFVLTILVFS